MINYSVDVLKDIQFRPDGYTDDCKIWQPYKVVHDPSEPFYKMDLAWKVLYLNDKYSADVSYLYVELPGNQAYLV